MKASKSIIHFLLIFSAILIIPIKGIAGHTLIFDGKKLKLSSKDTLIDLGELKVQNNASFRITVINESSVSFLISNVRGSCGLSIPSWPRNAMEPGEEQNIQIRFDASNPGNYTKILTIHSNTHNSRTVIPVVAEIIP